jgi:hypothetical protein
MTLMIGMVAILQILYYPQSIVSLKELDRYGHMAETDVLSKGLA